MDWKWSALLLYHVMSWKKYEQYCIARCVRCQHDCQTWNASEVMCNTKFDRNIYWVEIETFICTLNMVVLLNNEVNEVEKYDRLVFSNASSINFYMTSWDFYMAFEIIIVNIFTKIMDVVIFPQQYLLGIWDIQKTYHKCNNLAWSTAKNEKQHTKAWQIFKIPLPMSEFIKFHHLGQTNNSPLSLIGTARHADTIKSPLIVQ